MSLGKFLTIEGGEGAGKSTSIQFIQSELKAAGIDLVLTREPGGTALGEELRALLLAHREGGMDSDTELLLMFAARAEHIARVIHPALEEGKWVLSDRFTDATFAYQGGGRGIDVSRIENLEQWVQKGLQPDITFLLDLPVEQGLERARGRGELDRFETEALSFFETVRQSYLSRAQAHAERFRVIDSSGDIDSVNAQLRNVIEALV